ncbi:MAG: hypothetical protein ISS58_02250 [Dehalococcoidales bacterium]|nr:hypothetical protein [Dehalococcoidales bacterium]
MAKESAKRTIKDWLKIAVLLMDEAIAIALVLGALWFFKVRIPLWTAVVVALLLGGIVFITHKLVIPTFRARQVTGSAGMIGHVGEVMEPLTPKGTVKVEGEYWKAKSVDGDVAAGENVEILGLDKLTLEVKHKTE